MTGIEAIDPVQADDQHVTVGALQHSLGFLMRIAQLRVYDKFYARFADSDLRPGEFSILWVIHLNPGIRQGRLAQTLNIKPAHMTKTIRRLEDSAMVARHVPDADRRSVHLRLTTVGEDFVAANEAHFFGVNAYHDSDLTPDESRQLAGLLMKYCGFAPKETT
ncbi:MarR family winged helix-turn-helix transcriptional regulator [Loktanella sp. DJP18]|uniref:MarR family winged helix-turn-helix transcriptional regulator n=1 Tax=Loktanella sp. DJP18 TaxID=3409788 RepID=UPI003BB72438